MTTTHTATDAAAGAVPHVASAVLTRGCTPGVITAPTVVAPFAVWAWRRLRRAGVPIAATDSSGVRRVGTVPVPWSGRRFT